MAVTLFGGGKSDHPMADLEHVKMLVAGLPPNDFVKALAEVSVWLDTLNVVDELRLSRRFAVIDMIDRASQASYRKLNDRYQSAQRRQKFQENTLWTAASEFWQRLGDAYIRCIEEIWSDAGKVDTVKRELPVIVARALRALKFRMKWTLLRYAPVDVSLWSAVGRLYVFAESRDFCAKAVQIYPDYGYGTVQEEFLQVVMLGVSSLEGLNPAQQELADRAIAHFRALYALQPSPGTRCNFCFDLSLPKPPARIPKDFTTGKSIRCFGAGRAYRALGQLVGEIRRSEHAPADIDFGNGFDSDVVLSALEHLERQWADNPPARRTERRRIATKLTVLHGFDALVRATETVLDTASLDFEHAANVETWIVENVSEGGFGAAIPPIQGEWIRVGALLGMQIDAAQSWSAGIIRRILRSQPPQRSVGIQLLARTVIPVKLSMSSGGKNTADDATRADESALLLSTAPDQHGEVGLLVRSGSTVRDRPVELNVRGKRYHLSPRNLVESGEDFDWITFKVTARAG